MLHQLTNVSSFKTHQILQWLSAHCLQLFLCFLLLYLLIQKDVTLSISFQKERIAQVASKGVPVATALSTSTPSKKVAPNLTKAQEKQITYVKRFAKVAKEEMHKYGIPASIKLAQGLLETNAGDSKLATTNNNHFGIKCFSKKCHKGHCSNFSDDTHKDFFRKFETAWASYRAHSELLQNKRYIHLKGADYKTWAYGLSKAGYATDPAYGDKLVALIEGLELYAYDG